MPTVDPTQRFSSRVANYVHYRPGYPPEIIGLLRNQCGLGAGSVVADIGSGTGILTRLFLENGNVVYGVEPNPDMRAAGEEALGQYANFVSVNGRSEHTTLPARSINFVAAAQAAHWFDRVPTRAEFVRILEPAGWAVFIWNERRIGTTPFLREYEQLLLDYATDYKDVRHERTTETLSSFFAPQPHHEQVFENAQHFDYEGIQGRLLSSSYAPEAGHPKHEPMLRELRRIFDLYQENGRVTMEYNTRVFYGHLS